MLGIPTLEEYGVWQKAAARIQHDVEKVRPRSGINFASESRSGANVPLEAGGRGSEAG